VRRVSLVLGLWASAAVPAGAQVPAEPKPAVRTPEPPSPAPAPPVFGVGVDVVAVDASVVDDEGRPVLGLAPADFRVRVDGKPRTIASVEYVGRDLEPPPAARATPAHYSSNENAPRGRLVLLVVDRGNMGRGGGTQVLRTAERFLGTLAPADRVGLAFIPGPGGAIEFTSDLDQVRRGLKGVVGLADRAGYGVPLAEAIAHVRRRDGLRWQEYLGRECDFRTPREAEACRQQMESEAGQVYLAYRERSLATERTLASIFASLRRVDGPKSVILVSEGLGTESPSEARDLARAASEAQVTLYVVLVDTSGPDVASRRRTEIASADDRERETNGLYDLAGMSRGVVLNAGSTGEAAFRRIGSELTGYYLLGFEPEAADRDGRSHEVRVDVSRPSATVRARSLLTIPASAPTAEQMLAGALRSPLVERGLPIRATSYTVPASEPGKVRVLIAARVRGASRPLSVGYVLSGPDGKVAASRGYRDVAEGDGDWAEFAGEAVVPPATYRLRLAAVDASRRRGSIERTVRAALVDAGGLEISDLVLAPASGGAPVRPAVDLELSGGALSASIEVGARDAGRLGQAAAAIELAESADGPALLRAPVALGPPTEQGTRAARVEVGAGVLPPGDYTARAEVSVEGKVVAVVSRPFRIVPPRAGEAAPSSPLARLLVQPPPFDRAALLKPDVLGRLVDDVGAVVRGPAPAGVAAAIEEARRSRPEAMLDHLGDSGKEDARVAFLRGVSFYARGNLPAALTQLQAALRQSSELFPAAVYMGACYAAAGKDLDAIGAWQTALIGDSASPTLYALLGDALLRARQEKEAVEILKEGLDAFPDDAALRGRLGVAQAMAGNREEALPLLTAWVETNPDDTRALFATLALLFEGFSRSAAGAAPAEETQRLMRFARAYVGGKGPNREVIARWLEYLESREGG
jgi:VWFA-related protein